MAIPSAAPAAIFALVLLAGCARTPASDAGSAELPTPDPVVAAERAFAEFGYSDGVKTSFLRYSAPDAVVFAPGPVNAQEFFGARPDRDPNAPVQHLIWWPLWAGIAKSGDLGFTTGPYAVDEKRLGHYFTVWKLQPDGNWKWVIDAGVGADPSAEDAQGSPVGFLPTSSASSASPDSAMAEVTAAEAALAEAAASDLTAALEARLAPEARIHSDGPPPAKAPEHYAAALAVRAPAMAFSSPLGGGASNAGDFAWTYGDARWTGDDGAASRGFYVRVWQKRDSGWLIVFDELLPYEGPAEE